MGDIKNLPHKRFTKSRDEFWKRLFNEFSSKSADHSISGWSAAGLRQRFDTYRNVLKKLQLPNDELVLDLGCGSGFYARYLAESGFRVIGMDYAVKVVFEAQQRTQSSHVNYIAGDACSLPFKDKSFGHVLCIGLFQSLENHDLAINEIFRVLKPNSPFCLMTLNCKEIGTTLKRILVREEIIVVNGKPRPRLNTYDPHLFFKKIGKAGFIKTTLEPVQIIPAGIEGLNKLLPLWNNIPFFAYLTARSFIVTGWRPLN